MKKIILHIPHASTRLPRKEGFVANDEVIKKEVLRLTDWYIDQLFRFDKEIPIKANFSRIYCDVEGYVEGSKEIVPAREVDAIYKHTEGGEVLREVTPEMRKQILDNSYYPHYKNLENVVTQQIEKYQKALIVDCHSFFYQSASKFQDNSSHGPDFIIGTDIFHTPGCLINKAIRFFLKKGYTLGIDWPIRGSLVPKKYYQRSFDVNSIRIEVNRSLYLKHGTNKKSSSFVQIKNVIEEFLQLMHQTYYGDENDYTEKLISFRRINNQHLATFSDDLKELSDVEFINRFNREVNNKGWGNARSVFLIALRNELRNRNFGGVSVINETGGFNLNRKIKLVDGNLAFVSEEA